MDFWWVIWAVETRVFHSEFSIFQVMALLLILSPRTGPKTISKCETFLSFEGANSIEHALRTGNICSLFLSCPKKQHRHRGPYGLAGQ